MSVNIELASPTDLASMLELFPRLASFEVPNGRNPEQLWGGDEEMLRDWAASADENRIVQVARDAEGKLTGMTMVSLQPELLSHAPSAHLEVIVVSAAAEGRGIGKALLDAAEACARARGAKSMSLHVFANNARARKVYAGAGYDDELIRCIKPFTEDALA